MIDDIFLLVLALVGIAAIFAVLGWLAEKLERRK